MAKKKRKWKRGDHWTGYPDRPLPLAPFGSCPKTRNKGNQTLSDCNGCQYFKGTGPAFMNKIVSSLCTHPNLNRMIQGMTT
jgi:hypothetical protein